MSQEEHKKRIKRLKRLIIIGIITLLVLPIICCFIVMFRLNRLESQMKHLTTLYNENYKEYMQYVDSKNSGVVHAAENLTTEEPQVQATEEVQTTKEPQVQATEEVQATKEPQVQVTEEVQSTKKPKVQSTEVPEMPQVQATKAPIIEKGEETSKPETKKVYLTFDDGPSVYTEEILSVLKKYDVKATFFVIGKTDDYSKKMYRRIVEEEHTLAMHSYSHEYASIYSSVKAFKKDLQKIEELLTDVTGKTPKYYRFPGGSSNTVSKIDMKKFISCLNEEGIIYFDWNVINGDSVSGTVSKDTLVNNVITGIKNYDTSIVLMHDAGTKKTTVEALPKIIKSIKKQGADILPIDENTELVQHIRADSVN